MKNNFFIMRQYSEDCMEHLEGRPLRIHPMV
eukprot:CAMPEP_0119153394 /NCGR_PEP_ID=MMETSP1310-20130426/49197_1 /TAXON_ID=464262 /ORGANISM="Genus nov. species nov., Strain RCC2339" /LENGTH=30 /DNA_ID= /DNA_START= /DNA_END= /DNA_ORIENTATION=